MGHIVFAAPSIARFHLHERVARALRNRGHRVTVLATDPVGFGFYSAQGLPTWQVKPGLTRGLSTPLDSFAEHDCHLAGLSRPTLGQLTRAIRPLERSLGGLIRFFEVDTPDLLLLHQERDGMHRLLHFLGREYGCRILWTGDGLVPGTMQSDGEGLDGDASSCRLVPGDYRQVSGDETFLASVLASLLGRSLPPPLSRSRVRSPALHARLAASFSRAGRRHHPGFLGPLRAWREASAPPAIPTADYATFANRYVGQDTGAGPKVHKWFDCNSTCKMCSRRYMDKIADNTVVVHCRARIYYDVFT